MTYEQVIEKIPSKQNSKIINKDLALRLQKVSRHTPNDEVHLTDLADGNALICFQQGGQTILYSEVTGTAQKRPDTIPVLNEYLAGHGYHIELPPPSEKEKGAQIPVVRLVQDSTGKWVFLRNNVHFGNPRQAPATPVAPDVNIPPPSVYSESFTIDYDPTDDDEEEDE